MNRLDPLVISFLPLFLVYFLLINIDKIKNIIYFYFVIEMAKFASVTKENHPKFYGKRGSFSVSFLL